MRCYFKGCLEDGVTREHVPPKSFFPDGERTNLLTVPSCEKHNNDKKEDDFYVLSHICLGASKKNRARDIFMKKVVGQLNFNNQAMGRMIAKDSVMLSNGNVAYKVDEERFDNFFTSLTCGVLYSYYKESIPSGLSVRHIFHSLYDEDETMHEKAIKEEALNLYFGNMAKKMGFGEKLANNKNIYDVGMVGFSGYEGGIVVAHTFFGVFKVLSIVDND